MIDTMQAIKERHSVRSFTDEPLDEHDVKGFLW